MEGSTSMSTACPDSISLFNEHPPQLTRLDKQSYQEECSGRREEFTSVTTSVPLLARGHNRTECGAQVAGGRGRCLRRGAALARQAFDPGLVHQHLDGAVADSDAQGQGALGMHLL